MAERTGMDMIRDAAEIASLHLARHSHRVWLRIDCNRIANNPRLLKIHVDKLDTGIDLVLAPLWKQMAVG